MNYPHAVCACMLAACVSPHAATIAFPPSARVADITRPPYSADNTGTRDVSAILTKALGDDNRDQNGWGCHIVYLPNGTYLVDTTVQWRFPPYTVGPHLVGQSTSGVVIKLAKGTWPKGSEKKPVIQVGAGVAQNFNRGLSNLTVLVDSNNAGACGVLWYGNNQSLMSDVDIISADGKGMIGLDLGHWQEGGGEQGPCMARNVRVKGFDVGVRSNALNDVVLQTIGLDGQNKLGLLNDTHPLYIDGLTSKNMAPAVHNFGILVMVDAALLGGSPDTAAITNTGSGTLFARNITAKGYRWAIQSTVGTAPAGRTVAEWLSHAANRLWDSSPQKSLNLSKKLPPENNVSWESNLSKWAVIDSYPGSTDAQRLQAAIDDSTKTTIVLPRDRDYVLDTTVFLRGKIRRIIGTGGTLNGTGSIVVSDGSGCPAVVKLEKIGANSGSCPIIQRSKRTVIIECLLVGPILVEGPGDVFVTDVVVPMVVDHPKAHVWAWQFDSEGSGNDNLIVRNGTCRIFGWKDEGTGSPAHLLGGKTEILGFLEYSSAGDHTGMALVEIAGGAQVSIAGMSQTNFAGKYYKLLVTETRGAERRNLLSTDNVNGFNMPLYTSYSR